MPAKFGAGQMQELVAFDARTPVDDGYGNVVAGDWAEQFQDRAKFFFNHGSETVMAERLTGTEVINVQLWAHQATRAITTDWQMRDVRRGDAYNIRSVQEDKTGLVIDLLCESNVATG